MFSCVFVTFPCGGLGQVGYLIAACILNRLIVVYQICFSYLDQVINGLGATKRNSGKNTLKVQQMLNHV